MDSITHLIALAKPTAVLDKRCLLAGATEMTVPAYGEHDATFHLLLDGECTLQLADGSYPLRAGDAVILPGSPSHIVRTPRLAPREPAAPGGSASWQGVADTPGPAFGTLRSDLGGDPVIDLFCGYYSPGSWAGAMLFGSLPDPLIVSVAPDDDAVRALATMMRTEAGAANPGAGAILTSLCGALLAMILRRAGLTGAPLWTAAGDPRIAAAIDAVLQDPGADWSVERLARLASMSRATFVRHFGRHTGTTVNAFVTRIRMMVAADLLTREDLTVATVAARVGYQSESAFARAFHQATGRTPGRFRRSGATP
ncbi:AraC family transcriptional regulator [Kribbella sp. NPDC051770]|uniref:AraC family transcriptional regulator n=1 Tax=Kribbella sp. NPDC051770 TaxID=3155413 RepID=UPI00341827D3